MATRQIGDAHARIRGQDADARRCTHRLRLRPIRQQRAVEIGAEQNEVWMLVQASPRPNFPHGRVVDSDLGSETTRRDPQSGADAPAGSGTWQASKK